MKSRINKVLGVVVTVVMLTSLLVGVSVPASAAPGTMAYGVVATPSNIGAVLGGKTPAAGMIGNVDANFVAASADGLTVFAWDSTYKLMYKSTNAGAAWGSPVFVDTVTAALGLVISPKYATDTTIALFNATEVWVSNNGGGSFLSVAPADLATKLEGGAITSLDIGTWYSSNTLTIIIGVTAVAGTYSNVLKFTYGGFSWDNLGLITTAGIGNFSVLAVAFSPNHMSDAEVMCIYDDGTDTRLSSHFGTLEWNAFIPACTIVVSTLTTNAYIRTATDYVGNTGAPILVGLNGAGGILDDLYRVTGRAAAAGSAAKLISSTAGNSILTLAASGPAATANILFSTVATTVRKATGAFSGTFTAGTVSKQPNVNTAATNVYPVFGGANAFCGTTGTDSAVSISVDAGVTWNQVGLIDVGGTATATATIAAGAVSGFAGLAGGANYTAAPTVTILGGGTVTTVATVTATIAGGAVTGFAGLVGGAGYTTIPIVIITGNLANMSLVDLQVVDNNTMFVVMNNNIGGGYLARQVFKTTDGGTTWQRIYVSAAVSSVAVSPSYATDTSLILVDATTMVQKSVNGGASFVAFGVGAAVTTATMVDGTNFFAGGAAVSSVAALFKGGRWAAATGLPNATVTSIALNPKDTTKATIAVGLNNGSVYQSTNDGVSFAIVGTAPAAANINVAYGPDGSLYAGDSAAGIFRWTGTAWLLITAALPIRGIAVTTDGTLYAADFTAGNGFQRSLVPTGATLADCEFQAMNTAAFATYIGTYQLADIGVVYAATGNTVYGLETTTAASTYGYAGRIYGIVDTFTVAVTLSSPADKALLPVTSTTTATLTWANLTGAPTAGAGTTNTNYTPSVNTLSTFAGTAQTTNYAGAGALTTSPSAMTGGGTYYWRVRATSPINSRYSATRSFTTALSAVAPAALVEYPKTGSVAIPIDTTFTWPTVAGATGYEFVIAEDLGATDKFAIIDYGATTPVAAHKLLEDLKYNTTYWWRVRAANVTTKGDWAVFFFTTAKAPVVETTATTAPTTIVITENPPQQITLQIPPSPSPVQVIPNYLLWAVIAVGAVLVIAVIVLIVRTRRIS